MTLEEAKRLREGDRVITTANVENKGAVLVEGNETTVVSVQQNVFDTHNGCIVFVQAFMGSDQTAWPFECLERVASDALDEDAQAVVDEAVVEIGVQDALAASPKRGWWARFRGR